MSTTIKQDLKELYDCRSILRALVVKNLFGRYKNSIMGFAWHFIMPMVLMCVYYIVFNTIRAKAIPDFWVYMSCGIFPFIFMINNLKKGPAAITSNSGMVKKMYFPRSILVFSEVIYSFIVMLIGYLLVITAIIITGYKIELSLIVLPFILLLMLIFVTGYVLMLSSINVYIRDLQYLINSISMVFYFITPLDFSTDDVSGILSYVIAANPFAYYIRACQQIVYYGVFPSLDIVIVCAILPLVTMVMGAIIFRKLRRGFAERL